VTLPPRSTSLTPSSARVGPVSSSICWLTSVMIVPQQDLAVEILDRILGRSPEDVGDEIERSRGVQEDRRIEWLCAHVRSLPTGQREYDLPSGPRGLGIARRGRKTRLKNRRWCYRGEDAGLVMTERAVLTTPFYATSLSGHRIVDRSSTPARSDPYCLLEFSVKQKLQPIGKFLKPPQYFLGSGCIVDVAGLPRKMIRTYQPRHGSIFQRPTRPLL